MNTKITIFTEKIALLPPLRSGVLKTTRNDIQIEEIPQSAFSNIEFILVKLKTIPLLTICAGYVPHRTKLTQADLDTIILPVLFLIGGDLTSNHRNWNNLNRNINDCAVKNHSELRDHYHITQPILTDNWNPSNRDIFLSNVPYLYLCNTTHDLSSNHLPIELTLHRYRVERRSTITEHTDWIAYATLCNKINLNPHLISKQDVDTEIKNHQDHNNKTAK